MKYWKCRAVLLSVAIVFLVVAFSNSLVGGGKTIVASSYTSNSLKVLTREQEAILRSDPDYLVIPHSKEFTVTAEASSNDSGQVNYGPYKEISYHITLSCNIYKNRHTGAYAGTSEPTITPYYTGFGEMTFGDLSTGVYPSGSSVNIYGSVTATLFVSSVHIYYKPTYVNFDATI